MIGNGRGMKDVMRPTGATAGEKQDGEKKRTADLASNEGHKASRVPLPFTDDEVPNGIPPLFRGV
jgi:hypothetical protein